MYGGMLFVRGEYFFTPVELYGEWPFIADLCAGNGQLQFGLINAYMADDDFIADGEVLTNEKLELILQEAERKGDI